MRPGSVQLERRQVPKWFGEEEFKELSSFEKSIVTGLVMGGSRPAPKWSDLYAPEKKDRVSQCTSGVALMLGRGAVKNPEKAVELWTAAAAAFEPYSVFFLAMCHRYGMVLPKDAAKELDLLLRASAMGMKEACMEAGIILVRKGDEEKAAKEFEKGAQEKHWGCKYHLGMCKWRKTEFVEAIKLIKEAVEHGEEQAYYQLGMAYLKGRGVRTDENSAIRYLQMAVESGDETVSHNPEAMYLIGEAYKTGTGCKKSGKRARRWLERAAKLGHAKACFSVAEALFTAPNDVFKERDVERALKLFQESPGKDLPGVRYYLAKHMQEFSTEDEEEKKKKVLALGEQSAEEGYVPAYLEMSKLHEGSHLAEIWSEKYAEAIKPPEPRLCNTCKSSSEKMQRCGICKTTLYCSKDCQMRDYKAHSAICKPAPTTAEKE